MRAEGAHARKPGAVPGERGVVHRARPRAGLDDDRVEARARAHRVAEPLEAVATFGQLAVDADADPDSVPDDAEEIQNAAVEGATLLIAYGNEACQIDVPLFDVIAGV